MSYDCGRIKTNTEEGWRAEHIAHGNPARDDPKEQPPSYRIARLRCPCGASFVFMENEEGARNG